MINKKAVGLVLAVIVLVLSQILPSPEGLTEAGFSSILLFISAIVLWITEVLPMSISALLLIFLMPRVGIMDLTNCFEIFGGTAFFFVMATFALTVTIGSTTIPTRLCRGVISWAGSNSKKLILGMMLLAGFTSAIMSDLAVTALFIGLAKPMVEANGAKPGQSNLAKCLYIGIPVAANLGGFMTIAGTPGNIIIVDMIEQFVGLRVTFVDFMIIGVPLGFVTILIHWFILTHVLKPEPYGEEAIAKYQSSVTDNVPLSTREKKCLAIVIMMFTLWVISSWIPAIDTASVAILGMALFMMPGINVLKWDDFFHKTKWDVVFMCGTIPVLVAGMTQNGAPEWIIENLFSGMAGLNPIVVTLVCALIFMILRNLIPTGIAFIAFFAVPILGIAQMSGLSVTGMLMLLGFWSLQCLLLPFDPVYLMGYGDEYFKVKDMLRSGACSSLLIVLISGLYVPFVSILLGY